MGIHGDHWTENRAMAAYRRAVKMSVWVLSRSARAAIWAHMGFYVISKMEVA